MNDSQILSRHAELMDLWKIVGQNFEGQIYFGGWILRKDGRLWGRISRSDCGHTVADLYDTTDKLVLIFPSGKQVPVESASDVISVIVMNGGVN